MSDQISLLNIPLAAAADLSAKQYKFMKLSDDKTVNVCGAGEAMIGVLQNDPDAAGKSAEVMVYGVTNLVAGGTITVGAPLKSDSNGDAVVSSSDDEIFGAIALEAAVDNDVFSALLVGGFSYFSGSGDD